MTGTVYLIDSVRDTTITSTRADAVAALASRIRLLSVLPPSEIPLSSSCSLAPKRKDAQPNRTSVSGQPLIASSRAPRISSQSDLGSDPLRNSIVSRGRFRSRPA